MQGDPEELDKLLHNLGLIHKVGTREAPKPRNLTKNTSHKPVSKVEISHVSSKTSNQRSESRKPPSAKYMDDAFLNR